MKIAMISFTGNGRRLERSLAHELEKEGHQVLQAVKVQRTGIGQGCGKMQCQRMDR